MDTDDRTRCNGSRKGVISATIAQKPFTMSYFESGCWNDLVHHKLPRLRTPMGAGSPISTSHVRRHRATLIDRATWNRISRNDYSTLWCCRHLLGHGGMNTSVSSRRNLRRSRDPAVSSLSDGPILNRGASKQALSAPQAATPTSPKPTRRNRATVSKPYGSNHSGS